MSITDGPVRALADELHAALMAQDPLAATMLGVPGHDAELPDVSVEASRAFVALLTDVLARAGQLTAADADEAVTLAAIRAAAEAGVRTEQVATVEFTVSTFEQGPATLMLAASHTALATAQAAADHLARAGRYAAYVDACADRLRAGAAAGRTPASALLDRTAAQLAGWLAGEVPDPLGAVAAPPGADADFAERLAGIVETSTRPAIARYAALLDELRPVARDDERCGLVHLPGGAEAYEQLVGVHTTLPLSAAQVHETGLAALAEADAEMAGLGARLGLHGVAAVLERMRAESAAADPAAAMAQAQRAVEAAEAAAPQWFSAPLPGPCSVQPMDAGSARAGMAPHYVPPTPDGGRAGVYAFNLEVPGAGTGWDLEAVTFHETVPGHHLQIARDLLRPDLPALQRQWMVTAFTEGWGLYAESLAGEMDLYSSDEMRLGAVGMRAFRAARLVVDTGLHAQGWSRQQAIDTMLAHVPLPPSMLAAEVDRYLAAPGQALAYLIGQRELLALRGEAAAALGESFDPRGFHDALLGHGQVPLPAVRSAVEAWVAAGGPVAA